MLGMADPVGSARTVTSLLGGLPMAELDSVTVQSLGQAASCIGDFELADSIYTEAVIRLRTEGRLQVLARALLLQRGRGFVVASGRPRCRWPRRAGG